jgi:hypothetical protein
VHPLTCPCRLSTCRMYTSTRSRVCCVCVEGSGVHVEKVMFDQVSCVECILWRAPVGCPPATCAHIRKVGRRVGSKQFQRCLPSCLPPSPLAVELVVQTRVGAPRTFSTHARLSQVPVNPTGHNLSAFKVCVINAKARPKPQTQVSTCDSN